MGAAVFLKSLTLSNILSFGPEPQTVELGPLNVIIGPNGSGKSNFIEAIGLLKAAPRDIYEPIREGGGIDEWLWKGGENEHTAFLEVEVCHFKDNFIKYHCKFSSLVGEFVILKEELSASRGFIAGLPIVVDLKTILVGGHAESFSKKSIQYSSEKSVLAQMREPFAPHVAYSFGERLKSIGIFSEIQVGQSAPARLPQRTDLPNASLARDASNLGLILNRIKRDADARQALKPAIQELYENIDDIDMQIKDGKVQVFLYEKRMAVPATRLSSGTLRFLCLLAILLPPRAAAADLP